MKSFWFRLFTTVVYTYMLRPPFDTCSCVCVRGGGGEVFVCKKRKSGSAHEKKVNTKHKMRFDVFFLSTPICFCIFLDFWFFNRISLAAVEPIDKIHRLNIGPTLTATWSDELKEFQENVGYKTKRGGRVFEMFLTMQRNGD